MGERKVAMVIGGGRNIGRQIATTLACQGHDIAVVVRDHPAEAERVVADLRSKGYAAGAFIADVANSAEVNQAVDAAVDQFGRIDVLVNCAAIRLYISLLELTDEIWQTALSVNLSGPLYTSRAVLPYMVRQGGGAIINISGSAAIMGGRDLGAAMAPTKAGMHGLTHAIAAEFGPRGVRANTVVLSRIETDTMDPIDEERLQRELGTIALRRLGTTQEVADLCAYLASPAAGYVTGQTIQCSGGQYMT